MRTKKEKTSSPVELSEMESFINRKYPLNRFKENKLFACIFLFIFRYFLEFPGENYIQLDI